MMSPRFSFRRVAGLIRKESLQIVRDPSSIAIAFVLPLFLLFIFGYGVSLDAHHVRIGVVIENPTPASQSLVQALDGSPAFDVSQFRHRAPARAALMAGRFRGIIVLPADFDAAPARGETAQIQVLLDGTDPNTARLVQGYVQGAWEKWRTHEALQKGHHPITAVETRARIRYNPEVKSRNFLVPGLIAVIMSLIGTLLTALVIAREWERGTMEALMATPVSTVELMAGKLLPYFVLGMGGMALSVAVAVGPFAVPLRGSLWVLALCAAVFMIAALALGLMISTLTRDQMVASQVGIVAAFLPAIMLSGFIFDIPSMPAPIQGLTYLLAARYFVSILQTLFLVGDAWPAIWPNLLAMTAIAAVFLTITLRKTRKRLD